jgi:uncharacterized DUF497 family protein
MVAGEQNIRDHHIDFADVPPLFDGPTWERLDDRENYGEDRWVAVGLLRGIEVTVVYTMRGEDEDIRHLISARRATPHERKAYWKAIEGSTR